LIFYNGFNLLVDVIVATITGLSVYRYAWWQGYAAGTEDFIVQLMKQEEHELNKQREQE